MRMRHAIINGALIVILATSALIAPVTTRTARAATSIAPSALALDAGAFPAGAVITRNQVDHTAAAVNAEGILGGTPDKHGVLYQQLRFSGSITERALLPRYNGGVRTVWLMATVFPSATAAAQAYGSDAELGSTCTASPSVPVVTPLQTCAYGGAKATESGMYAIGTSGPVEFIVVGFIEKGSLAARDQAVRDASFVTQHEATHVATVLARGASTPIATGTPTARRNAPHPLPTTTPLPLHSAHQQPPVTNSKTIILTMAGDPWKLTLTRVTTMQRVHDDYNSYTAQGKYVLVFLTIQNMGKKPATPYSDQNFTLTDGQGRTFSVDSNADTTAGTQNNLDNSNSTVQPTFTIHTVFLFDVAKDATGLTLHNAESDGSNARTLFPLGI